MYVTQNTSIRLNRIQCRIGTSAGSPCKRHTGPLTPVLPIKQSTKLSRNLTNRQPQTLTFPELLRRRKRRQGWPHQKWIVLTLSANADCKDVSVVLGRLGPNDAVTYQAGDPREDTLWMANDIKCVDDTCEKKIPRGTATIYVHPMDEPAKKR